MKQAHQVYLTLTSGAGGMIALWLTNTMKIFLIKKTLATVIRYVAFAVIAIAAIYVARHWGMFKPYLDITRFTKN